MTDNTGDSGNPIGKNHHYKLKSPDFHEISEKALSSDESNNLHNKLIIIQVLNYKKRGYTNIKVNHANNNKSLPVQINGYTPDLSAVLNGTTTICAVETNDSLSDAQTVEKWKAFAGSGYQFHLIVPNHAFDEVKEIVRSNRISIDKYWRINDY